MIFLRHVTRLLFFRSVPSIVVPSRAQCQGAAQPRVSNFPQGSGIAGDSIPPVVAEEADDIPGDLADVVKNTDEDAQAVVVTPLLTVLSTCTFFPGEVDVPNSEYGFAVGMRHVCDGCLRRTTAWRPTAYGCMDGPREINTVNGPKVAARICSPVLSVACFPDGSPLEKVILAKSLGPNPLVYVSTSHGVELEVQAGSLVEEVHRPVTVSPRLQFIECRTEGSGR